MAYLHFITNGRFDYHKVYNQKLKENELDYILKAIIIACWDKIYEFDRIYTRDKTKSAACWEFVKENVVIDEYVKDELNKYLISESEFNNRQSIDLSEEEFYFKSLYDLLKDEGHLLNVLYDVSNNNSKFYNYKASVKNTIDRINRKNSVITLSKIKDLIQFRDSLETQEINVLNKINEELPVDFLKLYERVFKSRISFFDLIESQITSENEKNLFEELKELVEKFDLYPGLSINDMERIEQIVQSFNVQSFK
jgi:hypothetical protein